MFHPKEWAEQPVTREDLHRISFIKIFVARCSDSYVARDSDILRDAMRWCGARVALDR